MTHVRSTHAPRKNSPLRAVLRVVNVRVLNIVLLTVTAALFLAYLATVTQSATKGFTIRTLERQISVLEDEGRRLDVESVARQSMENIEGRVRELGFVPVSSVEYVSGSASTVAVR